MDENTKHIVASNLTAAYYAGMEPQLHAPDINDPLRKQSQMEQPFKEVIGVYVGFLDEMEKRET
jgi:hypothetical protein